MREDIGHDGTIRAAFHPGQHALRRLEWNLVQAECHGVVSFFRFGKCDHPRGNFK